MPHDSYAPLRLPNFRRILTSYALTTIAREGQIVVVGWQVYAHTKDPLSLGLIGLSEAVPFIAVALYAGHLADRLSRRGLALAGTFGLLLSAIVLLLFTVFPESFHGGIWPIYVVIFLSGLARSFTRPALTALSAELVPREMYANAVAWRSSTWQFAAVIGPAMGGLLYGFWGPVAAYGVVSALMAVALIGIFLVDHQSEPLPPSDVSVRESVSIGIRFIRSQPLILWAMSLDLFSVLFGGATALLPVFATLLHVGPQGLGVLRAAPAVGSVVIGVALAHRPPLRRAGRSLFLAVGFFGVTIILFALSRNFWLSLVLLTLGGMADNISVVIRSTMVQTMTPRELLGRVSAVNQIFIGASNEIGAFESGLAARLLGTVPSVIFGGVMTLVVVGVTALMAPQLREMREL